MGMSATLHIHEHERVEIECRHAISESRPRGYPVLSIGTLTIYPTVDRLRRLHAAVGAYLAAHDVDAGRELRPTVRCPRCDGRPKVYRDGLIDAICPVCAGSGSVSPWRPTMAVGGTEARASRAVRPIPAEACTDYAPSDCDDLPYDRLDPVDGAVVDGDELLAGIVETFGLDRERWDDFPRPATRGQKDKDMVEALGIETSYHGYIDGIDLGDVGRRNCPGEVP